MNKWIGCGRLVRDPEVRYSQGENSTAVARFTLAVDRKFKKNGESEADFISCIAFGKTAEFVEKYFHKGDKMIVEGHITTGSYTNKDGQKVYTTDINVEQVEFAESKRENGGQGGSSRPEPSSADVNGGFVGLGGIDDSELPFA
jgi:single-strand DNA-binding protein